MRYVYETRVESKKVGIEGSENVLKYWKWIDMSKRLVNFFETERNFDKNTLDKSK
jgi:hypothetical protein